MSLKQKCEAAFLQVVEDAGLFTGQLLRSDENQDTTLSLPSLSAIYTRLQGRPDSHGAHSGQESGFLTLALRTKAEIQEEQTTAPEDLHAANVDNVRASVVVPDLADLLNAAAVQPYTCFIVRPAATPRMEPVARAFQEMWTWEIVHVEVDCS